MPSYKRARKIFIAFATGGNLTHDLSFMRRALYLCATTAAHSKDI